MRADGFCLAVLPSFFFVLFAGSVFIWQRDQLNDRTKRERRSIFVSKKKKGIKGKTNIIIRIGPYYLGEWNENRAMTKANTRSHCTRFQLPWNGLYRIFSCLVVYPKGKNWNISPFCSDRTRNRFVVVVVVIESTFLRCALSLTIFQLIHDRRPICRLDRNDQICLFSMLFVQEFFSFCWSNVSLFEFRFLSFYECVCVCVWALPRMICFLLNSDCKSVTGVCARMRARSGTVSLRIVFYRSYQSMNPHTHTHIHSM